MHMHQRNILLYFYRKNSNIKASIAARKLQSVYGNEALDERTCRRWLKRMRDGRDDVNDLEDDPRSGRPSVFDEDRLRQIVEEDPNVTIRELAAVFECSISTIHQHLHSIGKVKIHVPSGHSQGSLHFCWLRSASWGNGFRIDSLPRTKPIACKLLLSF